MRHRITFLTLLLILILPVAAAAEQWIHVKVEGDERVTVNLPLSLLHAAAAMIPQEARHQGHVVIDDLDMDWQQLMDFWQEVKTAPDATFVTVESEDENVRVRKDGEFVIVETTEHSEDGAQVDARLPLAVIDALLSGPEGMLNFEAALQALADFGTGDLVTVRDGDETVRVWIDENNVAD